MPKALEGGEHDRGIIPASCYGGLGALPQSFFYLEPFYVRFNGGFMC